MDTINCLVIEDEPLAAELLEDYIEQVPQLVLKGVCGHTAPAARILEEGGIDLIFLDVHLHKASGIEFIKTIAAPPQIIITSAHKQYAMDGYELNIVDYLLKPIEFTRFQVAVNKVLLRLQNTVAETGGKSHLYFNVNKQKVKIYTDDILYIESLKEYIKIVTGKKSILTKMPITEVELLLDNTKFIRVHRSFIVAKANIDAVSAKGIQLTGKVIPIGRTYKQAVLASVETANQR